MLACWVFEAQHHIATKKKSKVKRSIDTYLFTSLKLDV